MSLIELGNFVESLVWFSIAIIFFVIPKKVEFYNKRISNSLGYAFILFGISDLIEMRTGAWWRPWWLLLIKALCLLFIVASFIINFSRKKIHGTN